MEFIDMGRRRAPSCAGCTRGWPGHHAADAGAFTRPVTAGSGISSIDELPDDARPSPTGQPTRADPGMGPGMMHRQMQPGQTGTGNMGPGQMQSHPPGNQ